MILRLICIGLLFVARLASAESLTVVVPVATVQEVPVPAQPALNIIPPPEEILWGPGQTIGFEFAIPPAVYINTLGSLSAIKIMAGSSYRFLIQMRIGETPAPYPPGLLPSAELRTARSPAGAVIANFAASVADAEQAIYLLSLSAVQTSALIRKTGIWEVTLPDDTGIPFIYSYAKFDVVPAVTLP